MLELPSGHGVDFRARLLRVRCSGRPWSGSLRMFNTLRIACLLWFAAMLWCGCDSVHELPEEPPEYPSEDAARISDRHGGTHMRTLVRGRIWYQTYGTELLVLDAHDGAVLSRLEPIPFGESGALVDIAILGKRMYVVADKDAVIELDLEDQRNPSVRQIRPSSDLGIRPRAVAAIGNEVWISGEGGVVSWNRDDAPLLDGSAITESVVTTQHGLAVPVGRRVHALNDGAYLGAASLLEPLPEEAGTIDGAMLFVLQGSEGASVGVMGADIRQLDDFAMRGTVHSVRYADGRIWAMGDTEIGTAELRPNGTVGPVEWIPLKGGRDMGGAGPNYLAVGGSFGRALFRFRQDSSGEGDSFLAVKRQPGRLNAGFDDGRRVLAGSPEGAWLYTIGDSVELTDRVITRNRPAADFAAATWGDVRIVEDGDAVIIHLADHDEQWRPPNGGKVRTLTVMGPRIWVGHDEGISLLRINGPDEAAEWAYFDLDPPPRLQTANLLRIPSGVTHLMPVRVGNEVVWISEFGGLGVAKAERVEVKEWANRNR